VVAAASPIAAENIGSEKEISPETPTYSNSVLLASSGGKTALSSRLSERGGIFVADRSNGTQAKIEEGHVQDVEKKNSTHIAYISRNLTGEGIRSMFRIRDMETEKTVSETNISREVNDIEKYGAQFRFANSSGIYTVANQTEPVSSTDIDEEAEVRDLEFFDNTSILATSGPDQIIVRDRNSSTRFNVSRPEDIQIIGLRPLNILIVHESRVVEYKSLGKGLEEVWSYSGLDNGRAVNRLSDNTTIIAERNSVFAVNSSGEEIWKKQFFSASDIEGSSKKAYSLEGHSSGVEVDSYWSPGKETPERRWPGFLEGLFEADFSSILG